jgi:hypothetical protein
MFFNSALQNSQKAMKMLSSWLTEASRSQLETARLARMLSEAIDTLLEEAKVPS